MNQQPNLEFHDISPNGAPPPSFIHAVEPGNAASCPYCGSPLLADPICSWFWWCETCTRRWWPEHLEYIQVLRERSYIAKPHPPTPTPEKPPISNPRTIFEPGLPIEPEKPI